jgi:hypothetical protein
MPNIFHCRDCSALEADNAFRLCTLGHILGPDGRPKEDRCLRPTNTEELHHLKTKLEGVDLANLKKISSGLHDYLSELGDKDFAVGRFYGEYCLKAKEIIVERGIYYKMIHKVLINLKDDKLRAEFIAMLDSAYDFDGYLIFGGYF